MLVKTLVNQVVWMKCNAVPKMHVLADPKKQANLHACLQFVSKFKPHYMFCSCFELFILVGLQQTMGLPSLLPIFAGNASFYSSSICCSSVIFVWSYKVIFSEK